MVRRHRVNNYRRQDGTPVRTHLRGKDPTKTPSKPAIQKYLDPTEKTRQEKERIETAISKARATLDLVCEEIDERLDALEQQLDADLRETTYKWVV